MLILTELCRTDSRRSTFLTIRCQEQAVMSVTGKRSPDEGDMSPDTLRRKKPHVYHCTGEKLKDVAKKAFFNLSNVYKWTGDLGEYTVWAYMNNKFMSKAGHSWPHAYVGKESQTVHAGMWFPDEDGNFKLVAAWTFSPGGDETSLHYLSEYRDDVLALWEAVEEDSEDSPITSEASAQHFTVSSGDDPVEQLECFSLDIITSEEMAAFEAAYKAGESEAGAANNA